MSKLITLSALSRFLAKVKAYVDEKAGAGLSGATGSEFAQKTIESQQDMIYNATSTDGVAYTATIPGVTALYAGLKITVKLDKTSASTMPTLNVNGLGAKGIRQPLTANSFSTTTAASNTWLNKACPITLTYTGSQWKTDFVRPSAAYLYGSVPVSAGGTGGTTADEALTNLGAASVSYVDQKIAELRALIERQ